MNNITKTIFSFFFAGIIASAQLVSAMNQYDGNNNMAHRSSHTTQERGIIIGVDDFVTGGIISPEQRAAFARQLFPTQIIVTPIYDLEQEFNDDDFESQYIEEIEIIPVFGREIYEKYYTPSLKSINIPTYFTKINNRAFVAFRELTSVTIPSSIVSIGMSAFYNCANLKDLAIPHSITEIKDSAFQGCKSLTRFSIPTSLSVISSHMLKDCASLKSLTIPSNITEIKRQSLQGCSNLTELNVLSSSVSRIDDSAFCGCINMTYFDIPTSVTYLGISNFDGWKLKSITLPSNITVIADGLFHGCTDLTNVEIDGDIQYVGCKAFVCCSNIKQLILPSSVSMIAAYSLYNCFNLTSLVIPDSAHISNDISNNTLNKAEVCIYKVIDEQQRVYNELLDAGVPKENIKIVENKSECI